MSTTNTSGTVGTVGTVLAGDAFSAAHADLWARIRAFDFDGVPPGGPRPAFGYADRLAREQGWGPSVAARVLEEYRRFLFLARTAGHPVTPSPMVDEAWHLHLTYTRSYWDRLCGGVLGMRLHHDPTRGGPVEQAKFVDWYARTKASYVRAFGETPPEDIWPGRHDATSPGPASDDAVKATGPAGLGGGRMLAAGIAAVVTGLVVLVVGGCSSGLSGSSGTVVAFAALGFGSLAVFALVLGWAWSRGGAGSAGGPGAAGPDAGRRPQRRDGTARSNDGGGCGTSAGWFWAGSTMSGGGGGGHPSRSHPPADEPGGRQGAEGGEGGGHAGDAGAGAGPGDGGSGSDGGGSGDGGGGGGTGCGGSSGCGGGGCGGGGD